MPIYERALANHGLVERVGLVVEVATGTVLGRIEVASGASNISVKAICRLCGHDRCSLFLYAMQDYGKKLESLCAWMKLGKSLSQTQHLEEATKVKVSHGVRVRGASASSMPSSAGAASAAGP